MDAGEVSALVTLNAIIDSILGLAIALLVVARVVRRQWTKWLDSDEAVPYFEKAAEQVMIKIEPRISGLEDRINEPIQIDLAPIVSMVTESVVPRVKEEVERVRAVIDGKIGFMRKVGKGIGEAVTEATGESIAEAAGGDAIGSEILGELDSLLADREWAAAHKAAAFGLRVLKRELGEGKGGGITLMGRGGYAPGLPGRKK